jgi:nitroimidazol reductase NimA-like FMN-containing flavoprotein (pyridoxamine 5'-phosphate oxidase superfamily)
MGIERSNRPVAASRIAATARELLDASTLCAIATVNADGRAHVNTAYFGWSRDFDIVWLSEPRARHSRNLRANESVAIAVYDSTQTWGKTDRGIARVSEQLSVFALLAHQLPSPCPRENGP